MVRMYLCQYVLLMYSSRGRYGYEFRVDVCKLNVASQVSSCGWHFHKPLIKEVTTWFWNLLRLRHCCSSANCKQIKLKNTEQNTTNDAY